MQKCLLLAQEVRVIDIVTYVYNSYPLYHKVWLYFVSSLNEKGKVAPFLVQN